MWLAWFVGFVFVFTILCFGVLRIIEILGEDDYDDRL